MGWTFTPSLNQRYDRKAFIADILERQEDDRDIWETIAHCLRGGNLWKVCQLTDKSTGEIQTFITCSLIRYGGYEHGWGCKDISEGMGPDITCPLSYLEMADEPTEGYAIEWRTNVRNYWAEKKHQARELKENFKKSLTIGSDRAKCILFLTCKSVPHVAVTTLRPLQGMYQGKLYCIPRKYIRRSEFKMEEQHHGH